MIFTFKRGIRQLNRRAWAFIFAGTVCVAICFVLLSRWMVQDPPIESVSPAQPGSMALASEKAQEITSLRTETPSLAPIVKSSPSVRHVLQVDRKRGVLNLIGALSWVPDGARLDLTFDLHCLGEGGNQRLLSRRNGRFQAPEQILHTTRLTSARLEDLDIYKIDVFDLIPRGGGKYFLQVRGLNYEMKSESFVLPSAIKDSVRKGMDHFVAVLPAGNPRAWVEGELSTLSKIPATDMPGSGMKLRHRQLTIGLFETGKDSLLAKGSIERTEDLTRFYASCIREGNLQLVVMAEHLPPVSYPVSLGFEKNLILHSPIQFPLSAKLAGRVHGFGGGQLTLIAERITEEPRKPIHIDSRSYAWDEGQFVSSSARATTDDQGRFAFKGLSPGSYRITLDGRNVSVLGEEGALCTIDRISKTGTSDIDFLFPMARVRISRLLPAGQAISGSFVVYTIHYGEVTVDPAGHGRPFVLSGERPEVMFVEPNIPLSISVPGEKNEPIEIWSGHSGPAGSETNALLIHSETAKSDPWIRSGGPGRIWVHK